MRRLNLRTRRLILLALLQLVAGPLVLLQVSVFCSLTVRETPHLGVPKAMVKAWKSETFQALLAGTTTATAQGDKGLPPGNDDKAGGDKAKLHFVSWQCPPMPWARPASLGGWQAQARTWTPAWPQAPPGTPPRVG